jgi:hypothetical protein
MATSLTPMVLSGSTNGKQIKIAASSTPGTTIHTAHATALDQIWLYADNDDASDILLTIEFGGTTDVDNTIKVTIPARGTAGRDGRVLVLDGEFLTNSLVVKAYAGTANKIKISGHVFRAVTS